MEERTQPYQPSAETLRRARVIWEQSEADLKQARQMMKRGAYLESSYMSLQSSLNALVAVCHLNGHFQLPASSALQLAELCRDADPRFDGLAEACEALEHVQARSPFTPDRDEADEREHSRLCYAHGDSILKTVRAYLKDNRRRFFKP